jgi:hypothetical protein
MGDAAVKLFDVGSVTVSGLKTEFGIGRTAAYELMSKGLLPWTQLGARRLIPRAAVARLLAEGLRGPVPADEQK